MHQEIEREEHVENFGEDTQGTEAKSPPHHHHQKKVELNKRRLIGKVFPSVHPFGTGFLRVFLIALIRRFGLQMFRSGCLCRPRCPCVLPIAPVSFIDIIL